VEGDAVGPIKARGQHLDLALAVLVGDRIDLVDQAAADEHGALVALGQRTRIGHAGGVDLDVEAGRYLEFGRRQFVGGGGERRTRDRRKLGRGVTVRTPDQRRARRKRRRGSGGSPGCRRRRLLCCSTKRKCTEKGARKQQAARRGKTDLHNVLPLWKPFPNASEPGAARMAFLIGTLRYFSIGVQSENILARDGDKTATRTE
jgi:hypothetical protein